MQELIERFERHISVERNLSPHTLRAYRQDLEAFRGFLAEELGWAEEGMAQRIDKLPDEREQLRVSAAPHTSGLIHHVRCHTSVPLAEGVASVAPSRGRS